MLGFPRLQLEKQKSDAAPLTWPVHVLFPLQNLRKPLYLRCQVVDWCIPILLHAVGAVYDVTTCYRGAKEPSIVGVINAEPCSADLNVRRYPISDIPTGSEKEMSDWLINLFKEKVSSREDTLYLSFLVGDLLSARS
jgi:hypothetical protein